MSTTLSSFGLGHHRQASVALLIDVPARAKITLSFESGNVA